MIVIGYNKRGLPTIEISHEDTIILEWLYYHEKNTSSINSLYHICCEELLKKYGCIGVKVYI